MRKSFFITFLFFINFSVASADSTAIRLLSKYVQIESVSGNENEAAYFMANECRKAGFVVEYINDTIGSVNFAASLYPLSWNKPNIIFHNHIDVVPAGSVKYWDYPPFGGVVHKGRIWGRGAMDNKGLAIIQFFAIKNFLRSSYDRDLPYNVTVLFVSWEETGGITGSKLVAKDFIERFNPQVVIGEGGAGMDDLGFLTKKNPIFGITIAEKQNLWLRLRWNTDYAGHASIVENDYASMLMVNGLYRLLNHPMPIIITHEAAIMFRALGEAIGGVKGSVMKKPDSRLFFKALELMSKNDPEVRDLVTNKITLSGIEANMTALNQNSNTESAYLDVRLLPGTSVEEIIYYIKSVINDDVVEIDIIDHGMASAGTLPEKYYAMLASAIEKEFADSKAIPMLFPASTDNNFFRSLGIPVYGINPMMVSGEQLKAIHNYNEFIKIEDITKGIAVFSAFLEELLYQ
jgi:carboxypeptidase PM20D1